VLSVSEERFELKRRMKRIALPKLIFLARERVDVGG
jgi:hypothetical protein